MEEEKPKIKPPTTRKPLTRKPINKLFTRRPGSRIPSRISLRPKATTTRPTPSRTTKASISKETTAKLSSSENPLTEEKSTKPPPKRRPKPSSRLNDIRNRLRNRTRRPTLSTPLVPKKDASAIEQNNNKVKIKTTRLPKSTLHKQSIDAERRKNIRLRRPSGLRPLSKTQRGAETKKNDDKDKKNEQVKIDDKTFSEDQSSSPTTSIKTSTLNDNNSPVTKRPVRRRTIDPEMRDKFRKFVLSKLSKNSTKTITVTTPIPDDSVNIVSQPLPHITKNTLPEVSTESYEERIRRFKEESKLTSMKLRNKTMGFSKDSVDFGRLSPKTTNIDSNNDKPQNSKDGLPKVKGEKVQIITAPPKNVNNDRNDFLVKVSASLNEHKTSKPLNVKSDTTTEPTMPKTTRHTERKTTVKRENTPEYNKENIQKETTSKPETTSPQKKENIEKDLPPMISALDQHSFRQPNKDIHKTHSDGRRKYSKPTFNFNINSFKTKQFEDDQTFSGSRPPVDYVTPNPSSGLRMGADEPKLPLEKLLPLFSFR